MTVTKTVTIPAATSPLGDVDPAYLLKGSYSVHVYVDPFRATDVTSSAAIAPAQPLGGPLSSAKTVSVTVSIPAGGLVYITIHLDFALKGVTGYPTDASSSYHEGFKFLDSMTVDGLSGAVSDVETLTAVGKNVTAIGGFVLDMNHLPKSALRVRVLSGGVLVATSSITPPDGYYFAGIPAGGPYVVELFNPTRSLVVRSAQVLAVANAQYVEEDFLGLNPADPAIEGFVFDADSQGLSGVTVQLYDRRDRLIASTESSASGWYAFRFTAPGSYTVRVLVPHGYVADRASATVGLRQFETGRVDFTLSR
jgi:hypothetical protein